MSGHSRGRLRHTLLALSCALPLRGVDAHAAPYIPQSDAQVLAAVPTGAAHASVETRQLARARADVALPLAQFYIARSRESGDLRNLGYAENALAPWVARISAAQAAALVLHATILQSRHVFAPALAELDHALALQPDDPQAWLTRAAILRVLGRYPEALSACARLERATEHAVAELCTQSIRALTGHLQDAYTAVERLGQDPVAPEVRAWRDSELGEMAERLGDDEEAERRLRGGLDLAPQDLYLRTAYADLLLRHRRAPETLALLHGYESIEPMLLRVVIARDLHGEVDNSALRALLGSAFALEQQRGEAVHRREQARFLLDVEQRPEAALAAAEDNWRVQREPDDLLILMRAARAAGKPEAAAPARQFVALQRLEDVRLAPYLTDHRS
jgi:tetratricopeptide (TPR) repeat protein